METQSDFRKDTFQCSFCNAFSQHRWYDRTTNLDIINSFIDEVYQNSRRTISQYDLHAVDEFVGSLQRNIPRYFTNFFPEKLAIAFCVSCNGLSLWVNQETVYPRQSTVPPPNQDMEERIQNLYLEAASILVDSPRGAAALLRLALQMLLKQIGMPGKNINEDIGSLVAEGMSPQIQQALDTLRVAGNHAVHPGQIDYEDNSDIADKLFEVLNSIADDMITRPKERKRLYESVVPAEQRQHIDKRDGD